MDLAVYEDQRCAICLAMCGERDNLFASNQMHLIASVHDVPDDFVKHYHVDVQCRHFAHTHCLLVAFRREHLRAFGGVLHCLKARRMSSVVTTNIMVHMCTYISVTPFHAMFSMRMSYDSSHARRTCKLSGQSPERGV